MSNDKKHTHYIVVNEVILGEASIVGTLNDWVSLAFVRLGVGEAKPFTDCASSKTIPSFPRSQTKSPRFSHPRS